MDADQTAETPVRAPKRPRKRMTRAQRIATAILALIAAVIIWEILTTFVAYTADAYVESDLIAAAPQVTGLITSVKIADDQTVSVGDPLLTIDPVPFQLTVDQHRAEVAKAQAQAAADQDEITAAQATVTAMTAAAIYAHQNAQRLTSLDTAHDVSQADADQAEDDARQADARLKASQAAVDRNRALMAMHQASFAAATASLAIAEWQLSRTNLLAPADGTITHLTTRAGDTAQADVPLIGIVDAHAWHIVANFEQSFIRNFNPGDTAWIWLDSHPWHLYRARVAGVARGISRSPEPTNLLPYVAPTTDWIRLQRRFPVTLTLIDPPPSLTLYMGADARVLILP